MVGFRVYGLGLCKGLRAEMKRTDYQGLSGTLTSASVVGILEERK